MVYEPLYHAQEIATIKLSSGCLVLQGEMSKIEQYLIVFNKTIIPLTLVGYEMIIANEARSAELAIYHLTDPTRARGIIVRHSTH